MENRKKLETALGEYVLLYNRVIYLVEQEIKGVVTADYYDSNFTIDDIEQVACFEKRTDCFFHMNHINLPEKCYMPLRGQGFAIKFIDANIQKTKELTFIYNCVFDKWVTHVDIEHIYNHDDIFETSYFDVFHKLSLMLRKQYNTAGEQYNKKVTELENLLKTIFEHHQTIKELNT